MLHSTAISILNYAQTATTLQLTRSMYRSIPTNQRRNGFPNCAQRLLRWALSSSAISTPSPLMPCHNR